jgi:ATP-binding cassette subfamily F protein uup
LVISHDRYFLERVCDRFVGLLGDGHLRDLPRGVDQYLEQREAMMTQMNESESPKKAISNAASERQLKKDLARLERQLEKIAEKVSSLKSAQENAAFDPAKLAQIDADLERARASQADLEEEWLSATLALGN